MKGKIAAVLESATRRGLWAVAITATMLVAGPAVAADAPEGDGAGDATLGVEREVIPDEAVWAMSAGLQSRGLSVIHCFGLSGGNYLSYYGDVFPKAGVVGSLERRLSAQTWVLLQISGGHANAEGEDLDDRLRITNGSLAVGLRHELWQRASAVISGFATVGGHGSRTLGRVLGNDVRVSESGVMASAGVAVDYRLVDGLFVGLSSPLVAVSWSTSKERAFDVDGEAYESGPVKGQRWSAGAHLSPELRLRFAF